MSLEMRYCPECREDQPFEQPHGAGDCPDAGDGEYAECPELCCTECGLALVIAVTSGGSARGVAGERDGARGGLGERAA